MGPYSHYLLAARLAPSLALENLPDYLWGAVAPDIRYLANLRRDHTHLEPERVQELLACNPQLTSFLTGYWVHILIDQVDVVQEVGAAFPLNLVQTVLRRKFSLQQMTMLVEMYFLQRGAGGAPLSGSYNPVLAGLGITAEQASRFQQGLQEYFDARSLDAAMTAFQKIGMLQNQRMEKYLNAYHAMQQRKAILAVLMLGVKNARLEARVLEHLRANMLI